MSGSHKDLLALRSGAKASSDDAADDRYYQATDANRNGRPVMSVDLVMKSGRRKGFYYHDIKFPEYEMGEDDEELVSFLAPPKIVVISGQGLHQLYEGLLRLTLKSVYEYDGRPAKPGEPIVTDIEIAEPSPQDRADKKLELVTPAKKAG